MANMTLIVDVPIYGFNFFPNQKYFKISPNWDCWFDICGDGFIH